MPWAKGKKQGLERLSPRRENYTPFLHETQGASVNFLSEGYKLITANYAPRGALLKKQGVAFQTSGMKQPRNGSPLGKLLRDLVNRDLFG